MQSQKPTLQMGQLLDSTSNQILKVENGHFLVQNLDTTQITTYTLPPLQFKQQKPTSSPPLKFLSKNNHIHLNPTANILTCKSLTFQQVEMNKTLSHQITYWSLYLPQRTPLFSVGIKNVELKKSHTFDFSINKPSTLTFKLDLEQNTFSCWFNEVKSEWHQPLKIEPECSWTPFVRVKNIGTHIILNSQVSDPQSSICSYVNSRPQKELTPFIQPTVNTLEQQKLQKNTQQYSLKKVTNNKFLLIGQNSLKLICRPQESAEFNLHFIQVTKQGNILVPLSDMQLRKLNEFSKRSNCSLFTLSIIKTPTTGYHISCTPYQWTTQILHALKTLNYLQQQSFARNKQKSLNISSLQINTITKIILQKVEMVNPHIKSSERIHSLYSQFNNMFNNTQKLPFFDKIKTPFTIPNQLTINNLPFIKFNSPIASVKTAHQHFAACLFKDGNRFSLLNISSIPFKIIDTIISRGFIKETEINQYKKQVEDINDSDFTKPHIFKILKNCLKYADKIKPPQKLIQQLEKKKEQHQVKKPTVMQQKPSIQPDKTLLNSLMQMGFGEKLSTKVLVESKNESLQAALDLIFNKYKTESDTPSQNKELTQKPKREWQCEMCTLINTRQTLKCSACDSPAPPQAMQESIQMMEQKKDQQTKIQEETEIISQNIENQSVKDFYIWHTDIPYCPVIIAAVFQSRIRFRLLGPNPKFYSSFYHKDNGFVDLSSLKYHDFPHQIDQTSINSMFYLSTNSQQQKRANWGWMNIEDYDYEMTNQTISIGSINFNSISQNNQSKLFNIEINLQNNSTSKLQCQITLENVYEERRRCLVVREVLNENIDKVEQKNDTKTNVLERKDHFIDQNRLILSKGTTVTCEFVKIVNHQIELFDPSTLLQTITHNNTSTALSKHNLIPMIAVQGPYSSTLNYPSCQLQSPSYETLNAAKAYRNGVVLRHTGNKKFTLGSIRLEQQKSQSKECQKAGYFYLTNDLNKQPLIKHEFSFTLSQMSKTTIQLTSKETAEYLVVVLNPQQAQNRITLNQISVYGQTVDSQPSHREEILEVSGLVDLKGLKVVWDRKELNKDSDSQGLSMTCELTDFPYDLSTLQPVTRKTLLQEILNTNMPITIRLHLQSSLNDSSQLLINSIFLPDYRLLTSLTISKPFQSQPLTLTQYKNCLQSFIHSPDPACFQLISKPENLLLKRELQQVDLTELVSKITLCHSGNEHLLINKFITFFAQQLPMNKSFSNHELIINAIKSPQLTSTGAELLFKLIKITNCLNFEELQTLLFSHLSNISIKKHQSPINPIQSNSQSNQKTIFSPLFQNLPKRQSITSEDEKIPIQHFISQKYPQGRKLIIDLMSLYKVQQIQLKLINIQKDKQKSKAILQLSIVNQKGIQSTISKEFFQQNIWAQFLSIGKITLSNLARDLSNPTRYLIVNLTFSPVPYYQSKQQSHHVSLEIIPTIKGTYVGECEAYLSSKFDPMTIDKLHMLKKVSNFVKYSCKSDQRLFYYTQDDEQSILKDKNTKSSSINISIPPKQHKQSKVSQLSHQNSLNYHSTLAYYIVNSMIDILDHPDSEQFIFKNDTLHLLVENLFNHQQGPILQKSLELLRKMISLNCQVLSQLMSEKISTQYLFITLFKQLNLTQNKDALDLIKKLINPSMLVQNKTIITNLSWLFKLYTFNPDLVQTLVKALLHSNHLQQTAPLFHKYGWTKDTVHVLNEMIKRNRTNRLGLIISSSRTNKQLADFAFNQLQSNNDKIFALVMSELAQKQRNTKVTQVQSILYFILEKINESQDQSRFQKRQQFLNVLEMLNTFGSTKKLAEQVIKTFFKLEQQNAYLCHLLASEFMKDTQAVETLLITTLRELISKPLQNDRLTLLGDVLSFILAKELNQNQPTILHLDQQTQTVLLSFFSNYLQDVLTIGGLESAKLPDQLTSLKIKIGFYLARLIKSQSLMTKISEQQLVNLIDWMMHNINVEPQKTKSLKTPTCQRFHHIQTTAWQIIESKANSDYKQFTKNYVSLYLKIKNQTNKMTNKTIKHNNMRKLYILNVKVLQSFAHHKELLQSLCVQNQLFEQILRQFISLELEDPERLTSGNVESQLVNELSLYPEAKQKPNDWLMYKNGQKNTVFKLQYPKNTQQLTELTFTHQEPFTPSKIIIAFRLQPTALDKNAAIPKSIAVEGGPTLNKLRHLGHMFQIKDERYYNLSTIIYGLNMDLRTTSNSLDNVNTAIKCLRFKIRSSDKVSIEDVLDGPEVIGVENRVGLVNFLSIQGYKQQDSQPYVSDLLRSLEILTRPEHRQLINSLFSVSSVVETFKESLTNFSHLMKNDNLQKVVHNFLMRVCQQNTQIGNQMLEKYLSIVNPEISSKIATQIIMSNDNELSLRVQMIFSFINKAITQRKAIDDKLSPFMNRFVQVSFYARTREQYFEKGKQLNPIQINLSPQMVQTLLLILKENSSSTQLVSTTMKFLETILTLTKPFVVSDFDLNSILNQIASRTNTLYDDLLAALVISSPECRQWFMSNNMLENLFEETFELIKSTNDVTKIVSNLSLLTTLSLNSAIKQLINKYQYNLKMFQLLMGKNYQSILSAPENQRIRKSFVQLITRTSLGSENQVIIGALLKDAIPSIISEGNEKFVGEIFLPLLNSYEKVPVCVLPYLEGQNKLITDFSNVDFRASSQPKPETKQKQQAISGFRLPSNLIDEQIKGRIFNNLQKSSYTNAKFNLALSHGKYSVGMGDAVRNNILNSNRPLLMVTKTRSKKDPNHLMTICAFYNRTKANPKNLNLNWTDGSFVLLIDNPDSLSYTNVMMLSKKSNKNPLFLQFLHHKLNKSPDYDQNGHYQDLLFFYDDKLFGGIPYQQNHQSSFCFYQFDMFDQSDDYDNFIPETVEFWLMHSTSLEKGEKSLVVVQQKSTLPQLTKSLLQSNYDHTLFNLSHKAPQTLNSLRYQTVYQFPTSITVRQLKENIRIINCSIDQKKIKDLRFSIKGKQISKTITDDMTLEDIRKMMKNKQSIILDINVHVDNLLDVLNLKSPFKREQVDFLPRKGILKYFEQNEGIQAMIKVIKKSIQGWKNKQKMQKWLQYVMQLQNFSHFPHFFAIYLKDKETFNLLFNLLAGLPDKETDPKWDVIQSSSSQKLLKIVSQILHMDKTPQFREYALKNNFFITILQRLRLLTGIFKRTYDKDYKQEQEQKQQSPNKGNVQDDGTKKIKKKKGVGYGNDSSSNTKWMKGDDLEARKKQFETIKTILQIVENFLDIQSSWKVPENLLSNIYESCLLPFIEDGLRAGTLLEISKHPEKFKAIFQIIRVLAKHEQLIPVLMPISQHYQPKQIQSIESLLKSLENISSIFLSCLTQSKTTQTNEQKISAELAVMIKQTYKLVEQAIEQYKENHMNDETQEKQLQQILQLPLDKKYRLLMKDLRFDYIDMKQTPNKIKHHYSSSFNPNYTPNQTKMIRLAQELADISTALPHEHTNAVFVRCDKDRVDFMQALIMGSNGTPYGHGAFLFDVYFDDNYPNNPPKVNLTTTGHGKVRFNPNLYACGKVCLSLLGTWRGSASQNWDAKVSTLLQVLLSIQAIIMSEQVYFNEPGFENQQGTQQGEKKNEAYSNIVRYCNIKYAMIENIRNPPKGFETVIRRHFYLKKDQIMEQCRKWQKYAEKRQANYVGLVNDHNHSWSNEFKKTKTTYKEMLDQAVKQLQEQLNKLPAPKITDIQTTKQTKKQSKKKAQTNKLQELQKQQSEQQIDVSYDKSLQNQQSKEIDITDQKVKDRWSRYIGAMGIDAVSKQSKADILVFGLNPLGLEIVKNLVLSGCRRLTIYDDQFVKMEDLAGGFFYTLEDVGKRRVDCILYKIRQLNAYVKIDSIPFIEQGLMANVIKSYSLVLATQIPLNQQLKISTLCRQHKVKFISADCRGFSARIINDLGDKFEVLDKNGQQPVEVFIKQITNGQKGIVTLLDGVKNPFEDGEAVIIRNVEGMKLKQSDQSKSINQTIHKVKVINSKSFEIGNTLNYTPYVRNGTVKNIKTPLQITYKTFAETALDNKKLTLDQNLQFYDFAKIQNSKLVKLCYLTLDEFRKKNKFQYPEAWSSKDMKIFVDIFKDVYGENIDEKTIKFVEKFALTCKGYLPPLCAFFGGMVCQQVIKAITQKYKPINSQFYIQFSEIVPQLPQQLNQNTLKEIYTYTKNSRQTGLEMVVGNQLVEVIRNSKLFMIGSGAIGCELLKNFAMIGFGTGEKGKITLTDPDHIENSNLNRQFLFRQKHISKSKSRTASEAVKLMNPALKNHILALTQRVSDSTKDIFTNKFFEGLTLVANALDNVAARRYVDQRCVENKVPLFQSGTLGPKGHVQVIIPYLTQSYGSQNDPVEEGQIPHCTLKMFPEETLHCVEWARDIFGKKFSLQPKALIKIIDKSYKPQKDDIKSLSECVTMVKKCPKTFEDCTNYAIKKFYKYYRDDVMQLLYTYPLNAKTKNGQPFWKLPKRPPTPILKFDPQNILQCTFVTSLAVMIAKIYQVEYPKNFRSQSERLHIGKLASKVKIDDFVPSDQKAKEILKQSSQKKQENVEQQKMQEVMQQKDEDQLYKEIITVGGHQFKIKAQQFEKDDDSNGHIDFIYSMANLRAINYKLDQMDWITVKIKAGRIVPALATTTACVSGLQTLEICKYLKKIKIDLMKNSYLNLAVPSIQMSQPGQVQKKKITQKLTVNLWDRWEIDCEKSSTFGDLYGKLLKKYQIFPVGVLQGMCRIDTGKTQEAKKQFLKDKILDKLDLEQNYIDIIVLFTKNQQDDKIIEGVPPVRLLFN